MSFRSITLAFKKAKSGELLEAVVRNDFGDVKSLLKHGADVNERNSNSGKTALIEATESRNKHLTYLLLEKGADTAAKDYVSGATALIKALEGGTGYGDEWIEALIKKSSLETLDAQDNDGVCALYLAAIQGRIKIVQALIDKGVALPPSVEAPHYSNAKGYGLEKDPSFLFSVAYINEYPAQLIGNAIVKKNPAQKPYVEAEIERFAKIKRDALERCEKERTQSDQHAAVLRMPGTIMCLTDGEKHLVQSIFGDEIDASLVTKHCHLEYHSTAAAQAFNNDVVFYGPKYHQADYSLADVFNFGLFVHELTHVWQYQSGVSWTRNPDLHPVSDPMYYSYTLKQEVGFKDFYIEQQAAMVEDYARLVYHPSKTPRWTISDSRDLLLKTVEDQFPMARETRLALEKHELTKPKTLQAPTL